MRALAIDPGNERSAYVLYDCDAGRPTEFGILKNDELLGGVYAMRGPRPGADHLAIEYMAPRGMPTSQEEMDTCVWVGRFVEAFAGPWSKVLRRKVKSTICGSQRARDGNIRQALIDRWGGKDVAVGCKAAPGPLYGVRRDVWQALAVAVTWAETGEPNL